MAECPMCDDYIHRIRELQDTIKRLRRKRQNSQDRWAMRNKDKVLAYRKDYRNKNREKIYNYQRDYKHKHRSRIRARQRRLYHLRYKKGRAAYRKKNLEKYRQYAREWARRNALKIRAHNIFKVAIVSGRIVRKPCEVCGESKSQAHHDDYLKPLKVRWLCISHHKKLHRKK